MSGTFVDSQTNKRTLGVWLSNQDGNNKRLLVAHGDAIAVGDPLFSADGQSVLFTAQHPGHFELHRYQIGQTFVETLRQNKGPINQSEVKALINGIVPTTQLTIVLPLDFDAPT
jgi:hypothetical protein